MPPSRMQTACFNGTNRKNLQHLKAYPSGQVLNQENLALSFIIFFYLS
jgi:hypothetical protein